MAITAKMSPTQWKIITEFTLFFFKCQCGTDKVVEEELYQGFEAVTLYNQYEWDAEGDDKKIYKVLDKLEAHLKQPMNLFYERNVFFDMKQQPTETIDQYVTKLETLNEKNTIKLKKKIIIIFSLILQAQITNRSIQL